MAGRTWEHNGAIAYLIVSCVLYVVGFASPHWSSVSSGGLTVRTGLWQECVENGFDEKCSSAVPADDDWFKVVQGLQGAALALWALSLLIGLIAKLASSSPTTPANILGLGSGLACVVGFVGALVFAGETSGEVNFLWAFAIDLVGLISGFVASLAVTLNKPGHKSLEDERVNAGHVNLGATDIEVANSCSERL